MSDRKVELERKKAKLQAMREEKKRKEEQKRKKGVRIVVLIRGYIIIGLPIVPVKNSGACCLRSTRS